MEAIRRTKNTKPKRKFLTTNGFLLALGLCLVAISILLWRSQESKNLSQLYLATESKARTYASETETRYNNIYNAIDRLASRGAPREVVDADEWEKDAEFYIDTFEGISSIAWVDETLRIRRIVPLEGNTSSIDQPVQEITGNPLDINLWMASNDGVEFNGYILATIDPAGIIAPVMNEIGDDYMLHISNEGTTILSSENWKQPQEEFTISRTIAFRDTVVLDFSFGPTDELIHSEIMNATRTLLASLLLSLIAIIAVFFAQNFGAIATSTELRYRNLFESSPDAIFVINLKGEYQDANPAATTMVGYSLSEIRNMTEDDLRVRSEAQSPDGRSHVEAEDKLQETFLRHKDGQIIPVDFAISPVREGEVEKYVLGIARDITARKRAQAELKEYSERLEEMVKERTRQLETAQEELVRREKQAVLGLLAGRMAHELRHPLGVISNAVYFIRAIVPKDDERVHEYLGILSAESHRAEDIISGLLDYTHARTPRAERLAVSDLISKVLAKKPPPENVQVATNLAPGLPPLFVDPTQIEQVLANLVTNAYQAMQQGGELAVSAHTQQDKVIDSVSDTGHGISEETKEKLFEPLFTTKAMGIGLGLAASEKLVNANRGSIEVQSHEGTGTTFTLVLPSGREQT